MNRNAARRLGVGVLLVNVGLLAAVVAAYGVGDAADSFVPNGVPLVTTALAGLLFVLGGTPNPLTRAVDWYRVVGLGYVVLAASLFAIGLNSGTLAPFGVLALGGAVLSGVGSLVLGVAFAYDPARFGFDVDAD